MDSLNLMEAIREALESGRMVIQDGLLVVDGNVVLPGPDNEYRVDGWSHETSKGCRRHKLIDQKLAELREGDKVEQQVAGLYAEWYAFFPQQLGVSGDEVHSIEADDEDERRIARRAAINAFSTFWQQVRNPLTVGFAVREDTDGDGVDETITLSNYRLVASPPDLADEITSFWPRYLVAQMDRAVESLRKPGRYWY